jgi:hypothetical protein
MEESFRVAMREMRREPVYAPGYIGGETLRDVANPAHYVVRIRPMLAEEERTSVLEPA